MPIQGYAARVAGTNPVTVALDGQAERIAKIKGHILKRAEPIEVLSRHGRQVPFPMHQSTTYIMRRWVPGYTYGEKDTVQDPNTGWNNWNRFFHDSNNVDPAKKFSDKHKLIEGHTPTDIKSLTAVDISVQIEQYGCLYGFTDKVALFYEDNIPQEMVKQAGERMALVNEMLVWAELKSNTNKFFGGTGSDTEGVNGTLTLNMIRKMTASLKRLHAKQTTSLLSASPNFGTEACEAGYFVFVHTNLEPVIRDLPGFTPTAEYGSGKSVPHECGKVENFRFITSPELAPKQNAGAAVSTTAGYEFTRDTATAATKNDVYSFVVLAQDHFCQLAVKGKNSMSPIFIPHDLISKDDPLGQRGYVGLNWWKSVKIENEGWGCIGEVLLPAL